MQNQFELDLGSEVGVGKGRVTGETSSHVWFGPGRWRKMPKFIVVGFAYYGSKFLSIQWSQVILSFYCSRFAATAVKTVRALNFRIMNQESFFFYIARVSTFIISAVV